MATQFRLNLISRRQGPAGERDMIATVQITTDGGDGSPSCTSATNAQCSNDTVSKILTGMLGGSDGLWPQACHLEITWDHLVFQGSLPPSIWVALGVHMRGWNFDGCSLALPGNRELVVLKAHRWAKEAGTLLAGNLDPAEPTWQMDISESNGEIKLL